MKQASLFFEMRAEQNGTGHAPTSRVAGRDGVAYIDLGDDRCRCVRVSPGGWEIVPHPVGGPYLYRTSRTAALPVPVASDVREMLDLDHGRIWKYVNVQGRRDRMLFLGWLVQALWPRGPYPLLELSGGHGSGKSTTQTVARALIDPVPASEQRHAPTDPGAQPPRDERAIAARAKNSHVLAIDNLSHIPEWLSDAFCRLATGGEISDRTLYSNFELEGFSAIRPVMISALHDVVTRADLASRAVKISVAVPAQRQSEKTFWSEFEHDRPAILGALLSALGGVMLHFHRTINPRDVADVRMEDFAKLGEALGITLSWQPGEFTHAYAESRKEAAAELGEQDAIFAPLEAALDECSGVYEGPMKGLLALLDARAPEHVKRERAWPKSPRALSSYLQARKEAL